MKIRIDKFLCDMGIGSRTEIKNYIKKKMITVNGEFVKSASDKVDSDMDSVSFNGQEIKYLEYEYFILNKPAGVISAADDKKCRTVIDLIEDRQRDDLFPVGRLDKDTEGLLIITNDGLLSHNLLSPKKHVDKTYYVETDGLLTAEHIELIANGLFIEEGFVAMPAKLEILDSKADGSKAYLTIKEGKFHQVKRMMEAVGNTVTYLKRISMGPLNLPSDLAVGEYRRLTENEINSLKEYEVC